MKTFEEIKNQLSANYRGYDDKENLTFAEYIERESANDSGFFRWFYDDDTLEDFVDPCDLSDEKYNQWNDFCEYAASCDTYDVCFDNDKSSDSKGWKVSYKYCRDFIRNNNHKGSQESYFSDYKGGTVSIYSNLLEEVVYSEKILDIRVIKGSSREKDYFEYEVNGESKWVQGELYYNRQKEQFEHIHCCDDGTEILIYWPDNLNH